MDEKREFSDRLRTAIQRAGYEARAAVVEHEFNQRWWGRSISLQAAWSWLNAKAIPAQDKLQVLAEWLKVEPQSLRFGDNVTQKVRGYHESRNQGLSAIEHEAVDAFLALPAHQRKLVQDVIFELSSLRKP